MEVPDTLIKEYITKKGRVLRDEDIDALAAEAEAGYDFDIAGVIMRQLKELLKEADALITYYHSSDCSDEVTDRVATWQSQASRFID